MSEDFEICMEVLGHVLFPLKPKFSEVCPCIDCMEKINLLHEFEQEILLKFKLVRQLDDQLLSYTQTCFDCYMATDWTTCFLDMLQKKLEVAYKKSGVSFPLKKSKSEEELRDIKHQMAKMLTDNDLVELDEEDDDQTADILLSLEIDSMIESGFFYYENTNLKGDTLSILKEIENIENKEEKDNKSDKPLEPSISKRNIEDQIKLVKKLPVNQLYCKCQKLVDKIISIDDLVKHRRMISEATNAIDKIYYAMIKIRRAFWQQYALSDPLTSDDDEEKHNMSGLKEALEALCNQAELFREVWKNNYAPYFAPFDRSDAKRLKTSI